MKTSSTSPAMKRLRSFLLKVFTANINEQSEPLEAELKQLVELDLYTENHSKRCYLSWRRAHCLFILPIALFGTIFAFLDMKEFGKKHKLYDKGNPEHWKKAMLYTDLGARIKVLPYLYPMAISFATLFSLFQWHQLQLSTRVIRYTWIVIMALTFTPVLFKAEDMLLNPLEGEGKENNKSKLVAYYTIAVLPTITTLRTCMTSFAFFFYYFDITMLKIQHIPSSLTL